MEQNTTTTAIANAQHRLLDELIEWERSLAKLYARYAELFPEDRDFWRHLSDEEKMHARILTPMHQVIDDGFLLNNIGQFRAEHISSEVDDVKQAIRLAKQGRVSYREAIRNAMKFETSVIDSQFYAIVECDSPIFERVAAVHARHGGEHVDQVRQRWEAILDEQESQSS